uniref:Serine aminopeptidase S33 domain-containing protein n=1 Tax=Chlamydomonas leiostraca TaxID=1034604 RepID=A0A7S0WRQ0_9CHLO|mmetsp:Transcript_25160/g.63845  ORF Transcript_25160/g.63845 Transcript_25160/m.63845 type:complete len:299 (+) Transcript_25160:149-1045(+)|eukprot:CAMPEP_0202859126 /NCGR_PEP_ID=MMETSP1391-20130828/1381_1 /ASSEMBLY_ACC=CAM_ASM_000867 /TAXON_ID=1034604 /ORGANISM="Chlamydomonas leiostraca, Strain SAG 11-49" /LENGTH=298 /DNA_ID=CAMNT_0049538135 /DNA_START=142 /DNA_END=1038 /DNA_ORIENTATION=-
MISTANFSSLKCINSRKQALHTETYLPAGRAPIATLVWHHGYGEHIGRYKQVFERIANSGIAICTYDAHGHGKSEPREPTSERAVVWNFNDLIDDVYDVVGQYRQLQPATASLPTFIGGHSMGGLVAAHAVLRQPGQWAGLVLHSAALDVEWTPVLRAQAPVSGLLSRVIPRARIVPAVRPEDMSQDAGVVADYLADPLNTVGNVPLRTGAQLLGGFRALAARYAHFRLPLYAAHGTQDRCTSLPAVRRFVEAAPARDKTLVEVAGGYHELLKGPEREQCTARLIQWVTARAAPTASL